MEMLRRLLEWYAPQGPALQDAFKRAHEHLACPPLPSGSDTSSSAAATSPLRIVDPYHLVVCQHGVLGSADDFENVIVDAFVSHEVSVLEATEMAAVSRQQRRAQPQQQAASMRDTVSAADKASVLHEAAISASAEKALTPEQRARRAAYKAAYRLHIEYPNRTRGRLYRSGNLAFFSPGSNEYLRTDAGTQACAQRMLAEVVPVLHAWLNEVESREQQRQAKWAAHAQMRGASGAAPLVAEAVAPLPVCLSLMGHSFGGILQREFLCLLLVDEAETRARDPLLFDAIATLRQRLQRLHVTFENFVTVATPHCGAGECLWWPVYAGAWCLARLNLCQTYGELLSDANCVLQRRLLDESHLHALQLFRRRVLFANTHRDIFVGFGTCSLIFENADTDHTKFVGVAPHRAHCAAAFVNELAEVSKPILLRSFEELEEGEAHGVGGCGDQRECQHAARARARTCTIDDLIATSVPSPNAADATMQHQALYSSSSKYAGTPVGVGEGCFDESNFLTASLRPRATSSSVSGLTASSESASSSCTQSLIPNSSAVTRAQPSSFVSLSAIGSARAAHSTEAVYSEELAALRTNSVNRGNNSLDNAPESSASALSTAGSMLWKLFTPLCRRSSSLILSSFVFEGDEAAAASDSRDHDDMGSVTSSRSSRNSSAITSLLRDPRWASERVCDVASAMQTEAKKWLQATPTTQPTGGATALGKPHVDCAMAMEGVMAPSECTSPAGSAQSPSALWMPGTEAELPQYRRAPRSIAATLRQKMSWRVRAIRLDNILPAGHVACLGNWAFCGRSPAVVQAIAEEMLTIL
ncbi:hypothetical protein LSCM1_06090 [Leishmania martiniquensis]|uniref:DUF676 domain-containing protein n=1 Tax=Leishmania martiniquensis TaxID=1580590 RepID=A0A836KLF7_9TRYP|nr:hypothetical protein LSCM1_06090 [Leishmania martiniquensis]